MPVCLSALGIASFGPMPITSGFTPATEKPTKRASGVQVVFLDRLFAGQHHRAGAIGHLRGVAGGDAAAELARCGTRSCSLASTSMRGAGARAFIGGDAAAVGDDAAGGQVRVMVVQRERADLVVELAGGLGGQRAAVALDREGVLLLAR